MYKYLSITALSLVLLGAGCATGSPAGVSETTISFTKNAIQVDIAQRADNTATAKMRFGVADGEEYLDLLGEQIAIMPSVINLTCQLYQQYYYDREAFEAFAASGEVQLDEEVISNLDNALRGYMLEDFQIIFEDTEDQEVIAECIGNNAVHEDMIFAGYRDYPASEFTGNIQIGDKAY